MAIKFLLATTGMQINMVSSWEDELYCSILKDGSISLRPSKDGEDEYGGRWWFPSRRGIKTPKQFVDAIYAIDEIEAGNWSVQDDMLPVLFEHAPLFASLTNLYIEIEDNQEDEDLDFFLFCQKVILSSEIDLPDDFKSAVKLIEIIFNFVKQEHSKTNEFPQGQRLLMDISVSFPKRSVKTKKERSDFHKEQLLKRHVKEAKWEIQETKPPGHAMYSPSLAMSQQRQDILDFCRQYFDQHNKLPVGKFHIGKTEVTFNAET